MTSNIRLYVSVIHDKNSLYVHMQQQHTDFTKHGPPTLFRKPLRTPAAFTDKDLGIRIVFSRITVKKIN